MSGGETLGYNDIAAEVVDNQEMKNEINTAIKSAIGEESGLEFECISEINKNQLGTILEKKFFPSLSPKPYSEIQENQHINFYLRAALQLIGKLDAYKNKQYNDTGGEVADTGKKIDVYLKEKGGLTNTHDDDVVKFLQQIVGAHPDGKAGPQTIYKIIEKLDGAKSDLARGVNDLYAGNEKFQIVLDNEAGGGDLETRNQGIISKLSLSVINKPNNSDYGLKEGVTLYKKDGKKGVCYFSGDTLYFYPNMSESENIPVKQKYLGESKREMVYPHNSKMIREYLAKNCLGKTLSENGIPLDGKSITYSNGQYFLKSFDDKVPIGLKTLSEGLIINGNTAEAIGQNLQLLNLQNFIKKTFKSKLDNGDIFDCDAKNGIFIKNSRGIKTHTVLDNNRNIRSSYPFFVDNEGLKRMIEYVKYLNTNILSLNS